MSDVMSKTYELSFQMTLNVTYHNMHGDCVSKHYENWDYEDKQC